MNDTPGTLIKLWRAAGCLPASRTITRDRLRLKPTSPLYISDRLVLWNARLVLWNARFLRRMWLLYLRIWLSGKVSPDFRDRVLQVVGLELERELPPIVREAFAHHPPWRAGQKISYETHLVFAQVIRNIVHGTVSL